MKIGFQWFKIAWDRATLGLLAILFCFWIIKLVYCGLGLVRNGTTGLQNAIIHGALVPRDPTQWGNPRWSLIALQYSGIALLTGLLGLANSRTLKSLWIALGHRSKPDA